MKDHFCRNTTRDFIIGLVVTFAGVYLGIKAADCKQRKQEKYRFVDKIEILKSEVKQNIVLTDSIPEDIVVKRRYLQNALGSLIKDEHFASFLESDDFEALYRYSNTIENSNNTLDILLQLKIADKITESNMKSIMKDYAHILNAQAVEVDSILKQYKDEEKNE